MKGDKKTVYLTILLIKQGYEHVGDVVRLDSCDPPIDVPIAGYGGGQLFIKKTSPTPPRWSLLFSDYLDIKLLSIPGVSAVFVLQVKGRRFALTFGQGGRFLLRDDVWEDRFGLLCALNSVDRSTFRCVDVQSLDAIQSHSRIQSGQETTPDQFGLDVEQDMLKAIVGAPSNPALGSRMTGADALTVAARVDLADLPPLLDEYRQKFEVDLSAKEYEWVNNISLVKSTGLIAKLEERLNEKLSVKEFEHIWLAIPELIDWGTVVGFMYSHGKKVIYRDISLEGFLSTLGSESPLTLEVLRARRVDCADVNHNKTFKSWPVVKCLYAELDLDGDKYILNDGKWFCISASFVTKTDSQFAAIPVSKLKLPEYDDGGEGKYNARVAALEPKRYALLDDTKKVMHGGGHGQVEICDLLSIDKELIHVKVYGKSSVFSHLFAQGFVSGQLIQIDRDFRKKVRAQLSPPFDELITEEARPGEGEFTVVYAVISESKEEALTLPFFSRVNLNNTARVLRGLGYKVELLKIAVNEMYAKTKKLPPKKS